MSCMKKWIVVDSWLLEFDDPFTRPNGWRESWDERDIRLLEKKFKNHDTLQSTIIIIIIIIMTKY